jgi:predicted transcriptional regulator
MSAPDPKFVLDLANEIETTKSTLAKLQSRWNALFATGTLPTTKRMGRKPNPTGNAAKVLKAINSNLATSWNADMVAEATRLSRKKVDKAVFNLCAANKIHRVGRGLYRGGPAPIAPIQARLQEAANVN